MASFNLGRIKGEKGDQGERGAKGDTGAKGDKGEKGEKGDRGTDAITPVFQVGNVESVDYSQSAHVEINNENPALPVLSFYIPKGKDGKDAAGDMLGSVYDVQGKNEDVFMYAQRLSDECLKKSGGGLSGLLRAYESSPAQMCVRNICLCDVLPETAGEGDVCIVVGQNDSKTLKECTDGSILLLDEGGTETEYILTGKNYYAQNSVTLVRKKLSPYKTFFDKNMRGSYLLSDIDILLESVYSGMFAENVRKNLLPVKIEGEVMRHCFLMTNNEMNAMTYFADNGKKAQINTSTSTDVYMTRQLNNSNMVYSIDASGNLSVLSQGSESYFRPAIVLPDSIEIENIMYKSSVAAKISEKKGGIYVYEDSTWRVCKI